MSFEYPSPTEGFVNQQHYLETMNERDSRGQRRYEVDQVFRDVVAAKLSLGYLRNGDTPLVPVANQDVGDGYVRMTGGAVVNPTALDDLVRDTAARSSAGQKDEFATFKVPEQIEGFKDPAEQTKFMASHRYANDAAFRQHVEARIAASDFSTYNDPNVSGHNSL